MSLDRSAWIGWSPPSLKRAFMPLPSDFLLSCCKRLRLSYIVREFVDMPKTKTSHPFMIWARVPMIVWTKYARGACPNQPWEKWSKRSLTRMMWKGSKRFLRRCERKLPTTTPTKLRRSWVLLPLHLPPRPQQRVQLLPFHARIIQSTWLPEPLLSVLAQEPRRSQTRCSKAFASLLLSTGR